MPTCKTCYAINEWWTNAGQTELLGAELKSMTKITPTVLSGLK